MLGGEMTEAAMTQYLNDLADRGESVDDLVGAARAMRRHVTGLVAPANAIDCCGTGGGGRHTLNISTAVALVVAACGVPVAKHGNRSHSSPSGAADVLEALGIPLQVGFEKLEDALDELGFCFLMAPMHHRAMANVAPVRKAIGRRTIFNLLGPLANPAGVRKQLIGVFDTAYLVPMAQALQKLGSDNAWIVNSDGVDEVTLAAPTKVAALSHGTIEQFTITPGDFGLNACTYEDIKGGDAQYNAKALTYLLDGGDGAYCDTVCANASAALVMAGAAPDLQSGVAMARDALTSGKAKDILNRYRDYVS